MDSPPMMSTTIYLMVYYLAGVGGTGSWLLRGSMVGILVIGSYVYHSDVIVTTMQSYVNRIQIHSTYYLPIYCLYKLVQLSQCSSDI